MSRGLRSRRVDHPSNISYSPVTVALGPADPEGLIDPGPGLPYLMGVGPQRSRPAYPRHFAQALHFARLPGRIVGGMSNFRNHRLGVGVGESDVQGNRAEYAQTS